jgi:hypothetical protein
MSNKQHTTGKEYVLFGVTCTRFHRCSSRHITGDDVSRETKRINATMASKATIVSQAIVLTM